jgi:hypothetical protein
MDPIFLTSPDARRRLVAANSGFNAESWWGPDRAPAAERC